MEIILSGLAGTAFLLWTAILLLPWQPWRIEEAFSVREGEAEADLGNITALIPARNEAKVIARTLESVILQGKGLRIIVVDDASADGTGDLARSVGGEGVEVLAGEPLPSGWVGKLWALEQGRRVVKTDYTLLLDADILLNPGTIYCLREKMSRGKLAFSSLMAAPAMDNFWEKLLMPAFVFFFKMLYPFRLANSPTSKIAAAAGGCVLMETGILQSMGGFAPLKSELIDDCALARQVKSRGYAAWIGLTRSIRSLRANQSLKEIWNMVARTAFTQLGYSFPLLMLCTVLMLIAYAVPLLLLFSPSPPVFALSGLALLIMFATYSPTLSFYRRSRAWGIGLPFIALLYLLMTWSSALRYYKGDRSLWKGRKYPKSVALP